VVEEVGRGLLPAGGSRLCHGHEQGRTQAIAGKRGRRRYQRGTGDLHRLRQVFLSASPEQRPGGALGAERGAELKERVLALFEELQQPLAEDDRRSRKSVTERAIEQLRPLYPELDETGLRALGWTFSFGLR
jgi:hypothetical protein